MTKAKAAKKMDMIAREISLEVRYNDTKEVKQLEKMVLGQVKGSVIGAMFLLKTKYGYKEGK